MPQRRPTLAGDQGPRLQRSADHGPGLGTTSATDHSGQRAAILYGLIATAKMNDVDPQAWLANVLARIADIPQTRLHELLPWNWPRAAEMKEAAA